LCGIWGYIFRRDSGITPVQRAIMATAMVIKMEERGQHSYGWYTSANNAITKGTGIPTMFVTPEDMVTSGIVLGHTRFASVGAQTPENAHPWRLNGPDGIQLVGMHNGGVADWENLNKKYDRKFQVDSQHLLQHIVEGRDLSELRAYGAVAFRYTSHPGSPEALNRIYLGKFNGGMLSIFGIHPPESDEETKARKARKEPRPTLGAVFASTPEACRIALRMAGLPYVNYTEYTVESGSLYFLDADPKFEDESSNCMFWYAEQDRKGLSLKSYSKEQARSAREGKAYNGWRDRAGAWHNSPTRFEIEEAVKVGFKGLRVYDIPKFFLGLTRYLGREACKYCGIVADFAIEDTKDLVCYNHWIRMIQDGDARVIPIRDVSRELSRVGEIGKVIDDDEPELKCDLCEDGHATLWDDASKSLACEGCANGEWREANWQPIDPKIEGGGSEKEPDDDYEDDYSLPAVVKDEVVETNHQDEARKDALAMAEEGRKRLFNSAPALTHRNGQIICEDCEDLPATKAYKISYNADGIRMHNAVSRVLLLCDTCCSVRKLNPERYAFIRVGKEIPLTDTTWGTPSSSVH
jgi:hypothetical protein